MAAKYPFEHVNICQYEIQMEICQRSHVQRDFYIVIIYEKAYKELGKALVLRQSEHEAYFFNEDNITPEKLICTSKVN